MYIRDRGGVDGESVGSEESFLMSYTLRNVSVVDLGRGCQFGFRPQKHHF